MVFELRELNPYTSGAMGAVYTRWLADIFTDWSEHRRVGPAGLRAAARAASPPEAGQFSNMGKALAAFTLEAAELCLVLVF